MLLCWLFQILVLLSKHFTLQSDASEYGLVAVLLQEERPVAFTAER